MRELLGEDEEEHKVVNGDYEDVAVPNNVQTKRTWNSFQDGVLKKMMEVRLETQEMKRLELLPSKSAMFAKRLFSTWISIKRYV
jgi:hypothetical protein